MSTVKVKINISESKTASIRLSIDDTMVPIDNGKAVFDASKNEDYAMYWFVRDVPAAKYSIEITEPKEIKMNYSATIDNSGKDSNSYWFNISE